MDILKKLWGSGIYGAALGLLIVAVASVAQPPATPGTPSAATGTITIMVNGQVVGAAPVLNLQAFGASVLPSGVVGSCSPNSTLNSIDCNFNTNTVYTPNVAQVQAGLNVCITATGTPAYACPTLGGIALQTYTTGQPIFLVPDVTCSTSCTVQIVQGAAPVAIKLSNGTMDPDGSLLGGQGRWIWFDGTVFRLSGV